MPNAQFLHIETYGPAPKKNAAHHQTISGILGEAARRPSSCQHIATPQRPNRLLGPDPAGSLTPARLAADLGVSESRASFLIATCRHILTEMVEQAECLGFQFGA